MPKMGMEPIRRAAVINAVLECICEKGIETITMDMVAEKAGCSKGVVAYYFKSKRLMILESFRGFLSYYQRKIQSDIIEGMTPCDMMKVVLDQGLPPQDERAEIEINSINVSELNGLKAMNIPPDKKAKLFLQFFSQASVDEDFQTIISEVYANDISGIASIIDYGIKDGSFTGTDAVKTAYGVLAMIIGLSFFRVAGIRLSDGADNRVICSDYIKAALIK
jgi:TetR/AcrR family transcriptional repressor of bet genes